MVQSGLGSLVLGYRPLWNAARRLAGIQLYVHSEGATLVDAPHLLRTIQELRTSSSPPLLLSARSQQLLVDLLEHAPRGAPWIEVPHAWLDVPAIRERARQAHARGLRLVWRGELDHLPDTDTARLFDNSLLHLSSTDAVLALQAAHAIPPERVMLMPEGTTSAVIRDRSRWLAPLALAHGMRLSDRLHIHLYGDTRGT